MDPFCYLCFMIIFSMLCSLVITCWERADYFDCFCVLFSFVYVTFPYGVWECSGSVV